MKATKQRTEMPYATNWEAPSLRPRTEKIGSKMQKGTSMAAIAPKIIF